MHFPTIWYAGLHFHVFTSLDGAAIVISPRKGDIHSLRYLTPRTTFSVSVRLFF